MQLTAVPETNVLLTRDKIVDVLIEYLRREIESKQERISDRKSNLHDPSETDRDTLSIQKRESLSRIAQDERFVQEMEYFRRFITSKTGEGLIGKIWLVKEEDGLKRLWIFHDPDLPGGGCYSISFGTEVARVLGVSEILTLSISCPFVKALKNAIVREGSNMTVDVEGNRPVKFTILATY